MEVTGCQNLLRIKQRRSLSDHFNMIVLGISAFFHDSSAAIIKDGILLAAAEEERFTRKKHDFGFPYHAIAFCLRKAGITIQQVDCIAFYEKPLLKFERVMSQFVASFPRGFSAFHKTMPSWINDKLRIRGIIKKKLHYAGDIYFVEHHLAHAASSYLLSPFDEAVILTVDGVGEWASATYGIAKGNEITLEKEIRFPHSLGLLYSAVTGYLGMSVNNSEYKVMGLAPYGKPLYVDKFRKVLHVKSDGSFALNMDYFVYHYRMAMPSKKFIAEFGPARQKQEEMTDRHKDIAASVQKILEDTLFTMLHNLHEKYACPNLCMAGGVALNSVANGKILKKTPFKKLFIQPAAGDGGTSVGAAAYVYHSLFGNKRAFVMKHAYLGPSYSNEVIKKYVDHMGIKYTEFVTEKELIQTTADLLWKNNVVGWFQGCMEFGPRALGARSILSNPCNPGMKDILNLKVKHREKFRPFAPVICLEDVHDYFEADKDVPLAADYMLMVYPIKEKKRVLIPAVTHVDGSGRLQVIRKEQNPRYYTLIKEFGKRSKVPILINTSFNIRGEPIVCTPQDAYKCMMGTGIDYLVMGKYLIKREDNPKHMWDSEKYATD